MPFTGCNSSSLRCKVLDSHMLVTGGVGRGKEKSRNPKLTTEDALWNQHQRESF